MIDWTVEGQKVRAVAARHNVDAAFIKAIRTVENGQSETALVLHSCNLSAIIEQCYAVRVSESSPNKSSFRQLSSVAEEDVSPAIVLLDGQNTQEIQKSIEPLNVPNIAVTKISIKNGQGSGGRTTQLAYTIKSANGIEQELSYSLSGLSFVLEGNASAVDTQAISQRYTSIIEALNKNSLRSRPISASHTRIYNVPLTSAQNVTSCVLIVMRPIISPNWTPITSLRSTMTLLTCLPEIEVVEYSLKAGREFGVLSVSAPSYDDQLAECVATVAHRLEAYPANPLTRCYGVDGHSRMRYNASFISYFASCWAPIGVTNDPNSLNKNWYPNCLKAYERFLQEDLA